MISTTIQRIWLGSDMEDPLFLVEVRVNQVMELLMDHLGSTKEISIRKVTTTTIMGVGDSWKNRKGSNFS